MKRTTLRSLRNRLPTLAALAAFIAFTVLVAAAGCSSTPRGVAALAGRYELRSVDGRALPDNRLAGAVAGELWLSPDGSARRVVQYARSGLPGPVTRRADGTFRVRGAEIALDLDEELRPSETRRRFARGELRPPTIRLRYPGPGERMSEELYVRVP